MTIASEQGASSTGEFKVSASRAREVELAVVSRDRRRWRGVEEIKEDVQAFGRRSLYLHSEEKLQQAATEDGDRNAHRLQARHSRLDSENVLDLKSSILDQSEDPLGLHLRKSVPRPSKVGDAIGGRTGIGGRVRRATRGGRPGRTMGGSGSGGRSGGRPGGGSGRVALF